MHGDRTTRPKPHFLFFTAMRFLKLATKFKSRTRGVTEADLNEYGAKLGNPKIFVSLVEWSDKIITK
ncbi:MAG: hypothetical protein DMF42_10010 [Verrucomicrobia bacterium]|nr:MAG: hypothetical protein DMF42_10010 [Verrucomicrobiota bacterium]